MEIISNCTQDDIKKAAKALKDGHLVAFPTETVYGLGADATNERAVGRIYSVKSRPSDHPLIVHLSSIHQLNNWAIDIPEYAMKLASQFWPGPMTLVLKRSELAKNFITGNQDTVGLRVPDQQVATALLKEFEKIGGLGISAPSANKFGAVSPTSASEVDDELGKSLSVNDLVLDGGRSVIGIESTIIDCTKKTPNVLRPGFISIEMVEQVTGIKSSLNFESSDVRSSGQLSSHYSPLATVILDQAPRAGEGFLAMANIETPSGAIRLGSPSSITEFASIMYSVLRLADRQGLKKIYVVLPLGTGLALAIRDRLKKAAFG
jgi:L-threonylcarbamoyladenylate synthase